MNILSPDSCHTPWGKSSRALIIAYLSWHGEEAWLGFIVYVSIISWSWGCSSAERESGGHLQSYCCVRNFPARRSAWGRDYRHPTHFPLEIFNPIICELRATISVFKTTVASIFCVESRGRKAPPPAGFDVLNLLLEGDIQMPSCTSGLGTLSSKLTPQRQAIGAGAGSKREGREQRRKTLLGTVTLERLDVQL